LCFDKDALSREYFVYFKKERRSQGANCPQDAEGAESRVCKKDKQKSLAATGKAQQDRGVYPGYPIYMSDFAGLSYRA
jgi:hypothetical protein